MTDIREADSIFAKACDFCPMVHINLFGADGEIFASGGLPVEHCEAFIEQIRAALKVIAETQRATVRRQ